MLVRRSVVEAQVNWSRFGRSIRDFQVIDEEKLKNAVM